MASVKELMKTMKSFETCSGLKINVEKTEAMWLGRSRFSNKTPLNLKWTNTAIKILGIYFTYDETEILNLNYNDKLKDLERTLNLWKMRGLTLIGRILVKTLGISKFTYVASVTEINKDIIKQVNKLIYNFIWKGKKPRIKKRTLIGNYEDGGLKAPDFETIYHSQRAFWIKRYLDSNEAYWKETLNHYLKKHGGSLITHCNFDINSGDIVLPKFYQESFKYWSKLLKCIKYRQTPMSQFIWNNKAVIIDQRCIYYADFMEAGIWTFGDLYENGNLIPFETWNKRGIKSSRYMAWQGIVSAIPPKIKKVTKR